MSESALYAGERDGARIFKFGRVGFDSGTGDLGSHVYTGVFKSERIAPAGPGALVNFRRVAIHVLANAPYEFTVKVWVDDVRTKLGTGATQTITIANTSISGLSEVTEEVEISAEGAHIQVEVSVDSDDVDGIFLIEGIYARGRVLRQGSTRTGEAT